MSLVGDECLTTLAEQRAKRVWLGMQQRFNSSEKIIQFNCPAPHRSVGTVHRRNVGRMKLPCGRKFLSKVALKSENRGTNYLRRLGRNQISRAGFGLGATVTARLTAADMV